MPTALSAQTGAGAELMPEAYPQLLSRLATRLVVLDTCRG